MDGRTDGHLRPTLLGRLEGVELISLKTPTNKQPKVTTCSKPATRTQCQSSLRQPL